MLSLPGKVYSLGRAEYGRLGLGQGSEEKSEPTLVSGLEASSNVACGASVSFAVTRDGEVTSEGSVQALAAHTFFPLFSTAMVSFPLTWLLYYCSLLKVKCVTFGHYEEER